MPINYTFVVTTEEMRRSIDHREFICSNFVYSPKYLAHVNGKTCGVIQDSLLGPLLFLPLFVNDLPSSLLSSKLSI